MTLFRTWLFGIVAAAMALALLYALVPKGALLTVAKCTGGLIMLQDGVPFPVEVTMDIPKNAALSRIIAADLGIDEAHQRWRETE